MSTISYRFTIVNPLAVSAFTPGMATVPDEHWCVTSLRGGQRPHIEERGITGDGQEIDLATGRVTDGAYRVRVIDIPATVGGGVAVNDEMNDVGVFTRWSQSSNGSWSPGPFGWGLGTLVGSGTTAENGMTLAGSVTSLAVDSECWVSRLFTGLTPSTAYTVTVGYYNRGCAALLAPGLGLPAGALEVFLRVDGIEVIGGGVYPPILSGSVPLSTISQSGVSSASGTLSVEFGVRSPYVQAILSLAMGVNWTRITPGTPATTGRYVTIALADSAARQQFLGRQAYIECSFDLGATWSRVMYAGYITDLSLAESLVYEFGVGDSRRAERVTTLFKRPRGTFDNATCIIGGPTKDGWEPFLPYIGRPTFVVESASFSTYDTSGNKTAQGEVILKYVSGPMPEAYNATGDNLTRENFDLINNRAREFWTEDPGVPERVNTTNNQVFSSGSFPELWVELSGLTGVVFPGATPWSWYANYFGAVPIHPWNRPFRDTLLGEGGRLRLPWDYPSPVAPPTVGALCQVVIYPRTVSDQYPIHIAGHPVGLVAAALSFAGVTLVNETAATLELGPQLYYYERITGTETVQSFCERLYAAFGFSTRVNADGDREAFVTRRKADSTPAVSVDVNTLRAEGGPTYELSESTKINQVRFRQQRHVLAVQEDANMRPWDDVETVEQTVVADLVTSWPDRTASGTVDPIGAVDASLDATVFGERQQEIGLGGQIWLQSVGEFSARSFARGIAEQIFDRNGRGAQMTTVVTRRGAGVDDVLIGDEITLDIPHNPNAQFDRSPTSQRGGSRRATVIRRVEESEGLIFTVVDAGTGTQPYTELEPTDDRWSVTQSIINPSTITINIDLITASLGGGVWGTALVTRGARIEVEVFVEVPPYGPGAPTGHGTLFTILDPGEYAHTPGASLTGDWRIPIGPFPLSTTVWVRLRTWVPGGSPSAWSSWKSSASSGSPVNGTISGLTVTAFTDNSVTLGWGSTDTVQAVTTAWRETALGGLYQLDDVLPPGSTQDTISGLTANTAYDFQVTLPDGTSLTVSQTTSNTGATQLATPSWPVAIGNGAGVYGLRVISTVAPATLVFESAAETSAGSGVAGTYSEFARQSAVLNAYVGASATASNDGKARYVRAKATWPGAIDSAYTAALVVSPWATAPVPGFPSIIPPGGTLPSIPGGTNPPGGGGGGGGGGLPSVPVTGRLICQIAALAVSSAAQSSSTVYVARTSHAHTVRSTHQCRLRLYRSTAARTADAARGSGTESYSADGLVMDVILADADGRLVTLDPVVTLGNADRNGSTTLYTLIDNLTNATADILVEIDLTPMEY